MNSTPPEAVSQSGCAVAKPYGMDVGVWGVPQCDGVKAGGSRSETAHQFPNFGAVAP